MPFLFMSCAFMAKRHKRQATRFGIPLKNRRRQNWFKFHVSPTAQADTPPGELLSTINELYAASTTPEREKAWADFIAGLKPLDDLATWTP